MENNNPLNGLREALKYSPDNVPLLELFAKACCDQWAFKEAEEAYSKILSLSPDHVQAGLGLAQIFYQTGATSQAAVRLESILKQHPQCAQGWLLLAKVSITEGNRGINGVVSHNKINFNSL